MIWADWISIEAAAALSALVGFRMIVSDFGAVIKVSESDTVPMRTNRESNKLQQHIMVASAHVHHQVSAIYLDSE